MENDELKNTLNNLTASEIVKFSKILNTFNQRGGNENNSIRALNAINVNSNANINTNANHGILQRFRTMIGGVLSTKLDNLKNFAIPNFLRNNKKKGGFIKQHQSLPQNTNETVNENPTTHHKVDTRLTALETAINKLNVITNNNTNHTNNQSGGGTKSKSSTKKTSVKHKKPSVKHKKPSVNHQKIEVKQKKTSVKHKKKEVQHKKTSVKHKKIIL